MISPILFELPVLASYAMVLTLAQKSTENEKILIYLCYSSVIVEHVTFVGANIVHEFHSFIYNN